GDLHTGMRGERGRLVDAERGAVADDPALVFDHELAFREVRLLGQQHLRRMAPLGTVDSSGELDQLRHIGWGRLAHLQARGVFGGFSGHANIMHSRACARVKTRAGGYTAAISASEPASRASPATV